MSPHFLAGPGVSLKKQGPTVKLRKPPLGIQPLVARGQCFFIHLFLKLDLPSALHPFFPFSLPGLLLSL